MTQKFYSKVFTKEKGRDRSTKELFKNFLAMLFIIGKNRVLTTRA